MYVGEEPCKKTRMSKILIHICLNISLQDIFDKSVSNLKDVFYCKNLFDIHHEIYYVEGHAIVSWISFNLYLASLNFNRGAEYHKIYVI